MRDRWIANAIVCLVFLGGSARASAQDAASALASPAPPARDASACVELALSVSPTALLSMLAVQFSSSSVGGLGTSIAPAFTPRFDVGIYLDRALVLTAGLAGSYHDLPQTSYSFSVPLSLLWYLEPPRIGAIMPTLRIGCGFSYGHLDLPPGVGIAVESIGGSLSAYGGITWLATRNLALRAEVGGAASIAWSEQPVGQTWAGALGLAGQVAVVLRV
jgi:hypothetical protein